MKIQDEHINVKNIKRIKKGSYEHTRSKDGMVTSSSTIYAIYIDFGGGYKETNWFYNKETRDELYNDLIKSVDDAIVNDSFRYYEDKNMLLVVGKKRKYEDCDVFIGTLFWVTNGEISNEGLHEIKEYNDGKTIDFTPIK